MSTTANAIIRSALGKLGIVAPGESVDANEAEDCLRALNVMLDGWATENLYAYALQLVDYTVLADTTSLTIGPTGDIVVSARPVRIEDGSYFTAGGVDYPMTPVSDAEYNGIGIKTLSGGLGPDVFNYNPSLSDGELRFYPEALSGNVLHLNVQTQISSFAALATSYTIPPGYERALIFSLAEEVAADYEREIPPTVARNAANARRFIKRLNFSVPQLQVGETHRTNLECIYSGG